MMKNIKLLTYMLILLSGVTFSSCLKDQKDFFDEPSSKRMSNYIANAQEVLRSAEHGWVFEVFPEANRRYGGYVYTVKFDSLSCTVQGQLAQTPETQVTSYYKMTNEGGAGFIFDTYNSLFHLLSEGTSNAYQARGGDVEYLLDSVGTDVVKVHGARSLNTCYLRKLDRPATDYLKDVANVMDNFVFSNYYGTVDGKVAHVSVNLNNNQLTFVPDTANQSAQTSTTAFVFTDKGIRLYEPLILNGTACSELTFDAEASAMTANGIVFTGELPANYRKFDVFEGTYTLTYNEGTRTRNVTLTPDKENNCYYMKGLFDNADLTVRLDYSKAGGYLYLNSQQVGTEGGNQVWLCALDTKIGNLIWNTNAGAKFTWNGNETAPVYTFGPNGQFDFDTDSFVVWTLTPGLSSVGRYSGTTYLINGGVLLQYVNTLTKQ